MEGEDILLFPSPYNTQSYKYSSNIYCTHSIQKEKTSRNTDSSLFIQMTMQ